MAVEPEEGLRSHHGEEGFVRSPEMTLGRLRWTVLAGAALFLVVLEYAFFVLLPVLSTWRGRALFLSIAGVVVFAFSIAVFRILEQMQSQLRRRNQELLALNAAGLDIMAELSLEVVLQKVVDTARELVSARYAALAVYRGDGSIRAFITSGIAESLVPQIGDPPRGRGLLGLVLNEGERLRVADIDAHPSSVGFPDGHPRMRSLLAVPLAGATPYRGNLYLTEKAGASEFSEEDEETVVRFSVQAAMAITNAHLHHQARGVARSEERLRLAHEMHDGLAQVLAYVNTKAQAVRELLRTSRPKEALEQLDQLSAAAREVYAEVRDAILGLRVTSAFGKPLARMLGEFIESWQDRSGVPVTSEIPEDLAVPQAIELQLLRVVQEALTNVRKHAQAEQAWVAMRRQGDVLVITVEDDGIGFDLRHQRRSEVPRFGLKTLQERAEGSGGSFEVGPREGGGTRVLVRFPLRRSSISDLLEETFHADSAG